MFNWFGGKKKEDEKTTIKSHKTSYCMYAIVKIQLTDSTIDSRIDDLRIDVTVSELLFTPEEAEIETNRLNDENTKEGVSYSWQSVKIHKKDE